MLQRDELKQMLHESAKKIAELITEEKVQENRLESLEAQQQHLQYEIEKQVVDTENKMYEGLQTCILALKECQDLPISYDNVVIELLKCMEVINSVDSLSKVGELLLSGTSFKSSLNISDNCMRSLYLGAENIFNNKEYEKAEKAFFALCSIDPTEFVYWIGLGHSAFQNKNYQQAINAYCMASALYPEDPWPHIWAANTFEEEKEYEDAKMAIGEALSIEKAKMPKNQELIQSLEERFQNIKVA